jgi:glutamine amidotransferase
MESAKQKIVTILEVGFGNLPSISRVIKQLNIDTKIAESAEDILEAEYLIIPGVGSFETAMNFLNEKNFCNILRTRTLELGLPTLGICLGAQIMFSIGHEGSTMKGLSIFDGSVENLTNKLAMKKSHTGWDNVTFVREFLGINEKESVDLFFNHDYIMIPDNDEEVSAVCDYGGRFAVALNKNNCYAVQFHPEKSQEPGLKLLRNFLGLHDV